MMMLVEESIIYLYFTEATVSLSLIQTNFRAGALIFRLPTF